MTDMTADLENSENQQDIFKNDAITTFHTANEAERELNRAWRRAEPECVETLLNASAIPDEINQRIHDLALELSHQLRDQKSASGKSGIVQGLLQEFSLSSQEGIALMCLAEALLRIPDQATRDLLIRDKINQGNWKEHVGQSSMMFVNAAAWGLMLTGKLMETPKQKSLSSMLTGLLERCGRGVIRKAVDSAMRMMGEQFVTGETIDEALRNAKALEAKGFRYSYDMLGEAALTEQDADRYYQDYLNAIHAIGKASHSEDEYSGPGISIKLSALHPRYQRAQVTRVLDELYAKVLELAKLAKHYRIGLNIDAEETERLELSLQLLERLCFEEQLAGWKGIGFVIQAYQKRCFYLVDYIVDLAKRSQKRLMIRLVKGAYWDSEIKKAQIDGMADYPVFTRKVHTDLSYIACAKKLLAAPEQVYPQFATHNALSMATIYNLADPAKYYPGQYEFQCLHGMGEALYQHVVGSKSEHKLGVPCRIYAPVGNHETLLAYLVRRLLENGANSSFVNQIADKNMDLEKLIQDPRQHILAAAQTDHHVVGAMHPALALPKDLYGTTRVNSHGIDLANDVDLKQLNEYAQRWSKQLWAAGAMGLGLSELADPQLAVSIRNPALHSDLVGEVIESNSAQINQALDNAEAAQIAWSQRPKNERAACLQRAADLMQQHLLHLLVLLSRESGKTYANGIAEVREAIDFLRYYAAQIIALDADTKIESLGTVLCISPWNFPLAIFSGQVAAALVAGNSVIAKPAEQTPLVAALAVDLFWQAGIPQDILQLLPGDGEKVGAQLTKDPRIQGIMFTGSTEVAKILQRTLAQRVSRFGQSIPLIAETGGQNAMIVDSSALTEQVVLDVVNSAFDSAGQRCSALRILCVQEDNADSVINMLKGAMQQLKVGQPYYLNTDIGPVIDQEAQINIQNHIDKMQAKGYKVEQLAANVDDVALADGTFIYPTLIELPHLDDLKREVFGPVLHVIRYKQGQLDNLLKQINDKGYGLTMGLHTRIDDTIQTVVDNAEVGNLYINRNIVGAVVGVQPFGGEGLSGTGPKAGGPLYIYRLMHACNHKQLDPLFATKMFNPKHPLPKAYDQLLQWCQQHVPTLQLKATALPVGQVMILQGPTGEDNQYLLLARPKILCLATDKQDLLYQISLALQISAEIVLLKSCKVSQDLVAHLPDALLQQIRMIDDLERDHFDAVLHHGSEEQLLALQKTIADRQGAIIAIHHQHLSQHDIAIERLVFERATSINTAAAGGNASLMALS